jgi:hypothetical protein
LCVARADGARVICEPRARNLVALAARNSAGASPEPSETFAGLVGTWRKAVHMSGLIYLVGLVVVILAILSFFGLR